MELGGEGSPGRRFMPLDMRGWVPFEEPEMGGVARLPRLLGKPGEGGTPLLEDAPYREYPDHSLPSLEDGESGPDRPFIIMLIGGGLWDGRFRDSWSLCLRRLQSRLWRGSRRESSHRLKQRGGREGCLGALV